MCYIMIMLCSISSYGRYVSVLCNFDGDMPCAINCNGGPHGWLVEAAWLTNPYPFQEMRREPEWDKY